MRDHNSPESHYDRAMANGFLTGRSEKEVAILWARMLHLIHNQHLAPHAAADVALAEEEAKHHPHPKN